jgi:uncharacterized protein (TIGR02996 family)
MSERAAFISAILDNPDNDTVRLVFADWLEEHGEAERAEFIRCQIEVARLPKILRDAIEPGKRAAEMLKKHEAEWRKVVPEKQVTEFQVGMGYGEINGFYHRGFLVFLGISSAEFCKVAGPLLTVEPASFSLFLFDEHSGGSKVTLEEVEQLAADPCLRAVTAIHYPVTEDRFTRLMKSPHLVNVREIDLTEFYIDAAHVRAIAEAPALRCLESLKLSAAFRAWPSSEELTPDAVAAVQILATGPRFQSLKHLDLTSNNLDSACVEVLLASELPRTLHLVLDGNEFDEDKYAQALAERFTGESDRREN